MNSSYLDDVALIQLFIKGKAHLASNEKLRVQSALDTDQLLARNGQILAIAQLKAEPPEIRVRHQSTYAELLDKTLRSHNFLPPSAESISGFTRYENYAGPEGYKLYCEPARLLWRQWWLRYRQNRPQFLDMELLLFTHQQWYPIRHIVFSSSTLFVTTYRGETAHQGEDLVIWAEKATPKANQPSPSLVGNRRQNRTVRSPASSSSAAVTVTQQAAVSKLKAAPVVAHQGMLPQTLRQVARYEAGKIYIKTALGELVVEGTNLRCQLTNMSA